MLSDHNFGVAAAGWMEAALATRKDPVPQILIDVNRSKEETRAQLPLGRPREVHRQRGNENNGDDEHRSPSPT